MNACVNQVLCVCPSYVKQSHRSTARFVFRVAVSVSRPLSTLVPCLLSPLFDEVRLDDYQIPVELCYEDGPACIVNGFRRGSSPVIVISRNHARGKCTLLLYHRCRRYGLYAAGIDRNPFRRVFHGLFGGR